MTLSAWEGFENSSSRPRSSATGWDSESVSWQLNLDLSPVVATRAVTGAVLAVFQVN